MGPREVHIEIIAYIAVCVPVGQDLINDFVTPVVYMRRERRYQRWCHAARCSKKTEGEKETGNKC